MFHDIQDKIHWLSKNISRSVLLELRKIVQRTLQESFAYNTIATRVSDLVILDSLYCYMRNARWTGLNLFQEIFCDYLICSFSLDRESCEQYARKLHNGLEELLPQNDMDVRSDKDFLRYLFICTCFAKQGDDPYTRFGFGSNVFKRIKNAIDITSEMSKDELTGDKARFIADIDAAFVEIIFEITEEHAAKPESLDLQKLSFLLSDLSPEEKVSIHATGIEKLLAGLCDIGEKRTLTTIEIQRMLQTDKDNSISLLNLLQKAELIYKVEDSANLSRVRWSLSELGLSIAAPAYAKAFWRNYSGDGWRHLLLMNGHYQESAIHHIPAGVLGECLELSNEQLKALSSRSMAALFQSLSEQGLRAIGGQLANRILMSEAMSPRLRKEACEYLSKFCFDEDVRLILQNVAESDASMAVRETALFGLANAATSPALETPN